MEINRRCTRMDLDLFVSICVHLRLRLRMAGTEARPTRTEARPTGKTPLKRD